MGDAKKRILIVDHEDAIATPLGHALARAGMESLHARDAAVALDLFRRAVPAAVLVRVDLGDGDGRQVCKMIRGRPDGSLVPILFFGHAVPTDPVRSTTEALEAGGDYFFRAPLDYAEVARRVTSWTAAESLAGPPELHLDLQYPQGVQSDAVTDMESPASPLPPRPVVPVKIRPLPDIPLESLPRWDDIPVTSSIDATSPSAIVIEEPQAERAASEASEAGGPASPGRTRSDPLPEVEVKSNRPDDESTLDYARAGADVEALVRQANLDNEGGDRAAAVASFEAAAALCEVGTQPGLAITLYRTILELEPSRTDIANRAAQLAMDLARDDDALAIYDGAADRLAVQGDLFDASELVRKMIAIRPGDPALVIRLASLEEQLMRATGEIVLESVKMRIPPAETVPAPPPRALVEEDDTGPDRPALAIPDAETEGDPRLAVRALAKPGSGEISASAFFAPTIEASVAMRARQVAGDLARAVQDAEAARARESGEHAGLSAELDAALEAAAQEAMEPVMVEEGLAPAPVHELDGPGLERALEEALDLAAAAAGSEPTPGPLPEDAADRAAIEGAVNEAMERAPSSAPHEAMRETAPGAPDPEEIELDRAMAAAADAVADDVEEATLDGVAGALQVVDADLDAPWPPVDADAFDENDETALARTLSTRAHMPDLRARAEPADASIQRDLLDLERSLESGELPEIEGADEPPTLHDIHLASITGRDARARTEPDREAPPFPKARTPSARRRRPTTREVRAEEARSVHDTREDLRSESKTALARRPRSASERATDEDRAAEDAHEPITAGEPAASDREARESIAGDAGDRELRVDQGARTGHARESIAGDASDRELHVDQGARTGHARESIAGDASDRELRVDHGARTSAGELEPLRARGGPHEPQGTAGPPEPAPEDRLEPRETRPAGAREPAPADRLAGATPAGALRVPAPADPVQRIGSGPRIGGSLVDHGEVPWGASQRERAVPPPAIAIDRDPLSMAPVLSVRDRRLAAVAAGAPVPPGFASLHEATTLGPGEPSGEWPDPPLAATWRPSARSAEPHPAAPYSLRPAAPSAPPRLEPVPIAPDHGAIHSLAEALALFVQLHARHATGVLELEGGPRLVVAAGDPLAVRGARAVQSFLGLLLKSGRVPQQVLQDLLASGLPDRPVEVGRSLVARTLLRDAECIVLLERQLEDTLAAALRHRGAWTFAATEVIAKEELVPAGGDLRDRLVDALARAVPLHELNAALGGTRAIVRAAPGYATIARSGDLRLLALLDGRYTLEEAIDLAAVAPDRAAALALVFVAFGLASALDRYPGRPSPRPAPPKAEPAIEAPAAGKRLATLEVLEPEPRLRALAEVVRTSDYFTILDISRGATSQEVAAAHAALRRLIRVEDFQRIEHIALARDVLRSIDEARDVLSVPALRAAYQQHLRPGVKIAPANLGGRSRVNGDCAPAHGHGRGCDGHACSR